MRVLVIPGTSESGIEILNAIRFSRGVVPLCASLDPDYGSALGYAESFALSSVSSEKFIPDLATLCERAKVDVIFPAHDEIAYVLRGFRPPEPVRIVRHSVAFHELARSKRAAYSRLERHVCTPRVFASLRDTADAVFPLFEKPDRGQGSVGAQSIPSREMLERRAGPSECSQKEYFERFVVTELVQGREVTVDCFSRPDGELVFSGQRHRELTRAGIAVFSRPMFDEAIDAAIQVLAEILRPSGAWFAQFKMRGEDPVLIDVGPRPAGSSGLWRANGVNLVEMALHQANGATVVTPRSAGSVGTARFLNHLPIGLSTPTEIALDFDDTIVVHGEVNLYAVALLSASNVACIPTAVISRHGGDLTAELDRLGLLPIIRRAIHLHNDVPKSTVLRPGSWMIDDSFRERQDALSVRGVRAFDVSAIPMLLSVICESALTP